MFEESLGDLFRKSFLTHKKNNAITFLRNGKVETEISYIELDRHTNRMAHGFQTLGIKKGDRVILFIQKSLFLVVSHLALQKLGAVSVPLNPGFKKSEMKYLILDAKAKAILSEPAKEALIRDIDPNLTNLVIDSQKPYHDIDIFNVISEKFIPNKIKSDDPGLIIYTSGTTGKPKGAILTQKNLIHNVRNIINIWEITNSDVLCHALPLFHIHGLCFALHTALMAGSVVLMLDEFSPDRILSVLGKEHRQYITTIFMAVPAMYVKLLNNVGEKKLDFEHLRLCTSGSAPLLPKDFKRIKRVFGKEPVEREGMSETGMNFSNPLKGKRKPGSIGLPLPDLEVKIVDPNTFEVMPQGQQGEIWLNGPAITSGYWRKQEETALAFDNGWFRTGDIGRIDEDGYYYLTDRIKHIINSGGENMSPKEVEILINRIGDVVESSVVGIPDEKWGEKVVAAVVLKPGSMVKSDDIKKFCNDHLHSWKCPKEVVLPKKLPKNTMGKILKESVKKLFNGQTTQVAHL